MSHALVPCHTKQAPNVATFNCSHPNHAHDPPSLDCLNFSSGKIFGDPREPEAHSAVGKPQVGAGPARNAPWHGGGSPGPLVQVVCWDACMPCHQASIQQD